MFFSNSSPTVLVVDDSKTDLEIISIVCEALGCTVDLASDGDNALESYKEKLHDLASQFDEISSKMHVIALSDHSLEDALDQGQIDDGFYFKVTMDQIDIPPTNTV